MSAIIIEGVLFIALLGVAGVLVVTIIRQYTPAGRAMAQRRNRKALERAASLTCARHGMHDEREMVRLESGEIVCPECFREAMAGDI